MVDDWIALAQRQHSGDPCCRLGSASPKHRIEQRSRPGVQACREVSWPYDWN